MIELGTLVLSEKNASHTCIRLETVSNLIQNKSKKTHTHQQQCRFGHLKVRTWNSGYSRTGLVIADGADCLPSLFELYLQITEIALIYHQVKISV